MPTTQPRKKAAARPPVDALQYEKLALSAFDLCTRQMHQLETLTTLASTLCRNPAVTVDERHRDRKMLELLAYTGEQYQQQLAGDLELFGVIALDAKGVVHQELTAKQATNMLANATKIATQAPVTAPASAPAPAPAPAPASAPTSAKITPRKRSSANCAAIVKKDRACRSVAVQH